MTPKEKAKELVWKYLPILEGWTDSYKTEKAKQCAIIAVDEVINGNFAEGYDHNFWTQVKTEINNL